MQAVVVEENPVVGENQGKSTGDKCNKKKSQQQPRTLAEELLNAKRKQQYLSDYKQKTKEKVEYWTREAASADFGYSAICDELAYLERQKAEGAPLDEPVRYADTLYLHGV